MTLRQRVLKHIYPLFVLFAGKRSKEKIINNKYPGVPPVAFYTLKTYLNTGNELNFNSLKDKKVLLVNTASDCGYTAQYTELQKLYEAYKDRLIIIGFPANDFKEQEKGNDEEIAQFCQINFGVTFPLAKKSSVLKSENQNVVFSWLSNANENGWNNQQPVWNFSKYLVNEQGLLTHYFDPSVSPLSDEVVKAIQE